MADKSKESCRGKLGSGRNDGENWARKGDKKLEKMFIAINVSYKYKSW